MLFRVQQSEINTLTSELNDARSSLEATDSEQSSTNEEFANARKTLENTQNHMRKVLAERDETACALEVTTRELDSVKVSQQISG